MSVVSGSYAEMRCGRCGRETPHVFDGARWRCDVAGCNAVNAENAESPDPSSETFPRLPRFPRRQKWEPPELDEAALHGPAGAWAEAVQPFTEASLAGVLVSTLLAFGNAAGRGAYAPVTATHHHGNEFALLVGPTATGRKGEAMTLGLRPLRLADEAGRIGSTAASAPVRRSSTRSETRSRARRRRAPTTSGCSCTSPSSRP